jgi:SpoVK/Ycf46/Vps4 family AAA+-type ATPase
MRGIIQRVAACAKEASYKITEDDIDSVHGLPLFQAEQALALGLAKKGDNSLFDLKKVWAVKKQLIETTRGLSVWTGGNDFSKIGGLDGVKNDLVQLFKGPKPPQLIVWLDEIEKSSLNSTKDSNGINSDMLGTMLSFVEDNNVLCKCFVGLPGTGKSELAKATGSQFNRITVRIDLSGMKDSRVGSSERNIRTALRLIREVSQGNAMFVATANSIDMLDTALVSRFSDVWFFDLPTASELAPIWDIHRDRLGIADNHLPKDTIGWVGRDVKQCCERAYRHSVSLKQASEYIVPTGIVSESEIQKLKEKASKRFLSASTGRVCS